MALSNQKIAALKVEYESGKLSKSKIAQKYRISRQTLEKYAREGLWVWAKNEQELSKLIEESSVKKMVQKNSDYLVNVNETYITETSNIERLTKDNLKAFYNLKELSPDGTIPKSEGDAFLTSQKFLSEAAKTYSLLFNDKRKALGLDKEKDPEKQLVTIDKIEIIGVDPDEDVGNS